MRLMRSLLQSLAVFLFVLLTAVPSDAQSDRGAIAGNVLDKTGAGIGAATVTATGADTGLVYKTSTSDAGAYSIPNMALGRYNVLIEQGNAAEGKDALDAALKQNPRLKNGAYYLGRRSSSSARRWRRRKKRRACRRLLVIPRQRICRKNVRSARLFGHPLLPNCEKCGAFREVVVPA